MLKKADKNAIRLQRHKRVRRKDKCNTIKQ